MYGHPSHPSTARPPVAVLTLDIEAGAELVQLTPDGLFRARDGRPKNIAGWVMNATIAARIIARLRERKSKIVVDYEHQTLNSETNGQPAPAAGWIDPQQVRYEPGTGLVAPVEWTARARAMIESGEYKYLSPVMPYDPRTGEVVDILHMALTNFPGLDGMAPIARLSAHYDLDPQPPTEDTVEKKQLIKLLGLADDASDEQVTAAITALKTKADEHDTAIAAKDQEIATLKAATADPSKHVPLAQFEEVKTELAALRTAQRNSEVDTLVKQGLEAGKLLAAQEAWARELGAANIDALKGYLEKTPAIAALKGSQTGGKKPEGVTDEGELDDAALAVCRQLGVDPEDYKKTLQA